MRDPIRRAEALLALDGVAVSDAEERAAAKADPEFLMEMLEQREALSEAKAGKDLEAVRRMAAAIEERVRGVGARARGGFRARRGRGRSRARSASCSSTGASSTR